MRSLNNLTVNAMVLDIKESRAFSCDPDPLCHPHPSREIAVNVRKINDRDLV
jgi:hypothetical protein